MSRRFDCLHLKDGDNYLSRNAGYFLPFGIVSSLRRLKS